MFFSVFLSCITSAHACCFKKLAFVVDDTGDFPIGTAGDKAAP